MRARERRQRDTFVLAEHKISVDVCGIDYWVTNSHGDVSSNEADAITHFTMPFAKRLVDEHFHDQQTTIICTNDD